MNSPRWLFPLIGTAAVGVAIAGCGGGGTSTAATKPMTSSGRPAELGVASTSKLGHVLVDSQGRTLYLFGADKEMKSSCNGACAAEWPPVIAGHKSVAGGLDAAKAGSTTRTGGARQITYNGHPLYRFAGDHRAGDTNGQGITAFGGTWAAVSTDGNAASGSSSSSGGYGGY